MELHLNNGCNNATSQCTPLQKKEINMKSLGEAQEFDNRKANRRLTVMKI